MKSTPINTRFSLLWLGQAASQFGDYMYNLTLLLFVYELSGSAFEVGKVLAFSIVPTIVLGPIAGVYGDLLPRKWIMIAADLARGMLVSLIPNTSDIRLVYVATAGMASLSVFFLPALTATIPNLVDHSGLLRANGLMATTRRIAQIAGPSVGGLLIGRYGLSLGFYLNAASFFFSALTILFLTVPQKIHRSGGPQRSFWTDISSAISLAWTSPTVFLLIALNIVLGLAIGANNVLVVAFVKDILRVDPDRFGVLMSMLGVGTLIGAMATTALGKRAQRAAFVRASLAVAGLAYFLFPLLPIYMISLVLRIGIGMGTMAYRVASATLMQTAVPDEFRSRVFGLSGALEDAAATLAMIGAGFLADMAGVRAAFLTSGTILLGGSMASLYLRREPAYPAREQQR